MTVSNIIEKRMNGFSWFFLKRSDMRQGKIWNVRGMLQLTHESEIVFHNIKTTDPEISGFDIMEKRVDEF